MIPATEPRHRAVPSCQGLTVRLFYPYPSGGDRVMLTLLYRALPCAADAALPERSFVVRETTPVTPPKPRLLDRVRQGIRARHYSRRTEKAYVAWTRRYILFHG